MESGLLRRLYLGCAGWSYKEWVGPLYDPGKSMLQQYARIFDTVELNSSFYRFPDKGTIFGLTRYTSRGFMFSAKLNQKFTHELRLQLNEEEQTELESFCELFDPLLTQERLGCMLIQLPPSLAIDLRLLEEFLAALPHRYEYVIEFRHKSWMDTDTWPLLSKYNVAYCIVDEPLLPPEIHVTSDIGYIRWHGHGKHPWYDYRYSAQDLKNWLPKIQEVQQSTKRTFGIFNNHFHGYAPENCIQIMQMLGIAEQKHTQALGRIQAHIEGRRAPTLVTGVPTLDQFVKPEEAKVEDLLVSFVSKSRLDRAAEVVPESVKIQESSADIIKGTVKQYRFSIDRSSRELFHDCADWEKLIVDKMLCKHMAKVFQTIPGEWARAVLVELQKNRDSWIFRGVQSE